jgi:hypothetical protein
MTEKNTNVLQFPVRPPASPGNPDAQNGCVCVHRFTHTIFNAGEDELTFYDYAYTFCDASGEEEMFEGFLTLGDAMHAGRVHADARNAVFES